jgi:outer membrane murein-binding lipoprotein Lpp
VEQRIDLEHRLTEVEARSKSNTKRLDEVEKRQDDLEVLATSVSALAAREERVESDVKEIKADVKTLAAKPGKRWDAIVDKAIWAVLAAIIAFLLGRLGL